MASILGFIQLVLSFVKDTGWRAKKTTFSSLPGCGLVFNVYIRQDALAFGAPLYLNMLCADPVVTCFELDPLSLDGRIQRASIPIMGEALRCTPYDAAQSIDFGDVFQLESILGEIYWHGYVKVEFREQKD